MPNLVEITDTNGSYDINLDQVTYISYKAGSTSIEFGEKRYISIDLTKEEFKAQLRKSKLDIIQED